MSRSSLLRTLGVIAVPIALTLTAGCEALRPKATPQSSFYTLDRAMMEAPSAAVSGSTGSLRTPTLIVDPPHAAAGFDSSRIVYTREAHRLEYFAYSEWVDTPARMLPPIMAAAIAHGGVVRTVVLAPSVASGDLRLDSEIIRLQQDFGFQPSRVRFTLRATIVDESTHKVIAGSEFDQTVAAVTDDPYGGVVAANAAVKSAMEDLATFCAEAAQTWRASHTDAPMPLKESFLGR